MKINFRVGKYEDNSKADNKSFLNARADPINL